jgi:ubiquinone/menaquinone biosynthesis C-methylase UbiE
MVKMATKNNKDFIEAGNLTISRGRSDDIPYSDSTFDKVYCNMVIYFWDHPEKHLREVHRVLKPGGKFYTGMRSRESMQVFPFVEYGFNLYESGEWKRILSENGFHITDQKVKKDPGLDFKEQELRLESHCIVASKV